MSRGFRVWDIEAEEYLPNSNGTSDGVLGISADGKNVIWLEDGEATFFEDGRSVIIEHSTGLKDKNGKEICEGDIVKITSCSFFEPDIGIVGFNECRGLYDAYTIENNRTYWETGSCFCSLMGREDFTTEVIGNIHENEDLLEGEK